MKLTTAGESHGKALIAVIVDCPRILKSTSGKSTASLRFARAASAGARGRR